MFICAKCKQKLEPNKEIIETRTGFINNAGGFTPTNAMEYLHCECYPGSSKA